MTPQKKAELLAKAKANLATAEAKRQLEAANKAQSTGTIKDLPVMQPIVAELTPQTAQVFTSQSAFKPLLANHTYNERQLEAIETGMRGKSLCLIGAAGTGKTTTTRELIAQMMQLAHVRPIEISTTYLQKDSPGVIVVGFTNKAVNNIRKLLPQALKAHCMTLHKLLEFGPVRDLEGKICGFAPKFDPENPLPHISVVFFEESSMIGTDLYNTYRNALPLGCEPQEVFLGDLNQLPPIFGDSILGHKLNALPIIELNHVYRQALESPIIYLAHAVKEGKSLPWKLGTKEGDPPTILDSGDQGKVTLLPWKKRLGEVAAVKTLGNMMTKLIESGGYNPEEDMILCPFNVRVGQVELNKYIADYLGRKRNAVVHEIIARGEKHYYAIGDRVLYDRQEAVITEIIVTPGYGGKIPQDPSELLNRWGEIGSHKSSETTSTSAPVDPEDYWTSSMIDEKQKNAASHTLKLEVCDTGLAVTVSDSGAINSMQFAYVQTVHKSQGSEWPRVFILLHFSHNVMLSRELMYTAITRARKELLIVLDPGQAGSMDSISKAAKSPEIKGTTIKEKMMHFKSRQFTFNPMATAKELIRKQEEAKKQQRLEMS